MSMFDSGRSTIILYLELNRYNLKIMGLMASDSGIFQCVASNPAGNIQASAVLKVATMG